MHGSKAAEAVRHQPHRARLSRNGLQQAIAPYAEIRRVPVVLLDTPRIRHHRLPPALPMRAAAAVQPGNDKRGYCHGDLLVDISPIYAVLPASKTKFLFFAAYGCADLLMQFLHCGSS